VTRWGIVPVALVAAVVSYRHMAGLLASYGEDAVTVTVGPIAVDGLMLLATGALLATGRRPATDSSVATHRTPPRTRHEPTPTKPDIAVRPAATAASARPPRPPAAASTDGGLATPGRQPADTTRSRAAAVATLLAGQPDITSGQVAAAIDVSGRTARRLLAAARASSAKAAWPTG
jgi:hypothetical protein